MPRVQEDRLLLVRIQHQIIVFELDDSYAPQCVAAVGNNRIRRCSGYPDMGSYAGWSQVFLPGTEGSISVMELGGIPEESFLRQRCDKHLNQDSPDVMPPSWVRFCPTKHAAAIRPNGPVWTPEGGIDAPISLLSRRIDFEGPGVGEPQEVDLVTLAEAARLAAPPVPSPTALYSYYDEGDRALYIGISDDLRTRTLNHIETSSWMDFAARSTIRRFDTRQEAADAEVEAIEAELPLFNHMHNAGPEARARLVTYLVERNRLDLLAPAVQRG